MMPPSPEPQRTYTRVDRKIFLAAYNAGLSYREIGKRIGRPKNWVCARVGQLIELGVIGRRQRASVNQHR